MRLVVRILSGMKLSTKRHAESMTPVSSRQCGRYLKRHNRQKQILSYEKTGK